VCKRKLLLLLLPPLLLLLTCARSDGSRCRAAHGPRGQGARRQDDQEAESR
jgi:hypothetical protein